MRVRRGPGEDAKAAARGLLQAVDAAEARGEEVVVEGLQPCLVGRPVRGLRIVNDHRQGRRIAWCAACEDAAECGGFFPDDPVEDLSRAARPRLRPFDAAVATRHFQRLRKTESLPEEPLRSIEQALLERAASRPWSPTTPLEFSIAWRGGRVYRYRFSCTLPDGCAGKVADDFAFARQLLGLVPELDADAFAAAWPDPANVVHVLFGLEAGIEAVDGGISRTKVYFAMREGPHMIGLDALRGGALVRKVYRRGEGPADDVRIESPEGVPKAVDVPLLRRNLGWDAVERLLPDSSDVLAIGAEIVPTRLSRSCTDPGDAALYYWVR